MTTMQGTTSYKSPRIEVVDETTFLDRVDTPWKVGAHVSALGGVENAVTNAASIG
jgi:AP endonuclease 1